MFTISALDEEHRMYTRHLLLIKSIDEFVRMIPGTKWMRNELRGGNSK
jgi:hypothetical protein